MSTPLKIELSMMAMTLKKLHRVQVMNGKRNLRTASTSPWKDSMGELSL
jgi:hypothetical protein